MSASSRSNRHGRRWMRLLGFLAVVPVVAAVAQVWAPQAASGAVIANETYQFPLTIDMNTCTSPVEPVALSGNFHIVVSTTTDNKGGYHTTTTSDTQSVTGTGLITGLKYSSSTTDTDTWNADPPFPQTHTYTHNYTLTSQGGTANVVLKITFHVTVNANGFPTATVDNIQSGCKG